jgi:hypothetical protein
MTTPRGEADEPAPIRETGVGWPDQAPAPPRPAPRSKPEPAPPPGAAPDPASEPPRRFGPTPPTDPSFADAVQRYRASTSPAARSAYEYRVAPQRPGTVTAAAVILFISAGLGLLACCGIYYLASGADLDNAAQTVLLVFTAVIVVFSLFNGVLGYFILQGRQWARITTIVLCALGIAGSVASLLIGAGGEDAGSSGLSTCTGLALNIAIIVLLSGERASDYFRYARG